MLKQKLTSRKFWMAIAGALLIIFNEGLELGIPEETYWGVVALILGYIFGEAAVDVARLKNELVEGPQSDENGQGNSSIPAAP